LRETRGDASSIFSFSFLLVCWFFPFASKSFFSPNPPLFSEFRTVFSGGRVSLCQHQGPLLAGRAFLPPFPAVSFLDLFLSPFRCLTLLPPCQSSNPALPPGLFFFCHKAAVEPLESRRFSGVSATPLFVLLSGDWRFALSKEIESPMSAYSPFSFHGSFFFFEFRVTFFSPFVPSFPAFGLHAQNLPCSIQPLLSNRLFFPALPSFWPPAS